jgi:hypothetical protein
MRVELHNSLQTPLVQEATQVVVRDIFGDPLAIAIEQLPGVYIVSNRGDPNWAKVLYSLGLRDTVITDHIAAPQPRSLVLPQ